MADTNFQEKLPWYQSEAFKTTATILVILMIPVAAFAWNVFSGNGSLKDIQDAFNISSSDTKRDDDSANNDDSGDADSNNQANSNNGTNGSKGMPNTPGVIKYKVVKGDDVKSISIKVCSDNTFYMQNTKLQVKEGQTLNINCNVYD